MLPAAAGEPQQTDEDLKWQALKRKIIRDRLRDKQEQEADAEAIRQRREREQKRKQDVMTMGDMKDQLKEHQSRLGNLTDSKHQLFLSLKKVLNEDDSRRRAVRESTGDVVSVAGSYPPGLGANTIFLQPAQRLPMYKVSPAGSSGPHPGSQGAGPIPVQGASIGPGPSGTKRPRSTSPPPHGYHPFNNYKTSPSLFPPQSSANASASSPYAPPSSVASPASASQHGKSVQIQHPPQHANPPQHSQDENRRNHDFPRAVLWNKGGGPPFVNVYGGVYGVAPSGPVYSYASAPPGGTYEQVYTSRQSYDGKPEGEKLYLRGPAGPIQMGVHSPHAPKAGLTTAFPVRPTHQHSAYLTPSGAGSTRLLYGSSHSTATVQSPAARYQSSGAL